MERIKRFHGVHLDDIEIDVFDFKVQKFLDMDEVIEVINVEKLSKSNGKTTSIDVTIKYKFIGKYEQLFDDQVIFGGTL